MAESTKPIRMPPGIQMRDGEALNNRRGGQRWDLAVTENQNSVMTGCREVIEDESHVFG